MVNIKDILKICVIFKRWFISNVMKKKITFTNEDWTGQVVITLKQNGETNMTWTRGNTAMEEGVRNRAFVFCHSETAQHIPEGYCKFLYTIIIPSGWTNSGQSFTVTKYIRPTLC